MKQNDDNEIIFFSIYSEATIPTSFCRCSSKCIPCTPLITVFSQSTRCDCPSLHYSYFVVLPFPDDHYVQWMLVHLMHWEVLHYYSPYRLHCVWYSIASLCHYHAPHAHVLLGHRCDSFHENLYEALAEPSRSKSETHVYLYAHHDLLVRPHKALFHTIQMTCSRSRLSSHFPAQGNPQRQNHASLHG